MKEILGIDVGATGIKGAIVDLDNGILSSERIKYKTPKPSTQVAVLKVIGKIITDFNWQGKPIGVGFPSIIKNGVCHSASNIHESWIGYNLLENLESRFSCVATLLNDADAAGVAEMKFGRGKNIESGITILLTLGTGIGSAIFHNKTLLPNTELGHLKFKDSITEKYASNSARERKELSWKEWGKELNEVNNHIDFIFSPDRIIIGGGVSKKYEQYEKYLELAHKTIPAKLLNNAGIIGAALAMYKKLNMEITVV